MVRFPLVLTAFVLVLAVPLRLRADAVGPPTVTCVEGAVPRGCHGGSYCAPYDCRTDASCEFGHACREVAFCFGPVPCWTDPTEGVFGRCPRGDECPAGQTCRTRRIWLGDCTPPPPADSGPAGRLLIGGCTCHAGPAVPGVGAATLAVLVVGILVARRRRQATGRSTARMS